MRTPAQLLMMLAILFFCSRHLLGERSETFLFIDITQKARITFKHYSGAFGKKYLPETMGSGCAFLDYDNDEWQDLMFVNSAGFPGHRSQKSTSALYRNNRDGSFTDVSHEVGLDVEIYGMGVAVGDYDNDGWDDIFISGLYDCVLLHNEKGRFRKVTQESGIKVIGFGASCTWLDFDLDGKLDLFVGNYAKWSEENDKFCSGDGVRKNYCHPRDYPPDRSQLFRNLGKGAFEDVSRRSGVDTPDCKALGVVVVDYNRDGWPDIFVANDTVPHKLFENKKNGTFADVGLERGIALDGNGSTRAGMGVDAADYDHSGFPSFVIGNFATEMLSLYHNTRGEFFVDRADSVGIGDPSYYSLTFGSLFFDYNLDGWEDIIVTNGHIMDDIHEYDKKLTYPQRALLFRNIGGGKFVSTPNEIAPDLFEPLVGRGLASGDIDNDGDLDVLISQNNNVPKLFRNELSSHNHWLQVKTVGTRSNRNGYGAWLRLTVEKSVQTKTVKSGTSYCSQSQSIVTFGLGKAAKVDVLEIHWPSGVEQEFRDLSVNQRITITEGSGLKRRE